MENTDSKRREILNILEFCLIAAISFPAYVQSESMRVGVRNSSEFKQAVADPKPGTTILLEPGTYSGGIYLHNISGIDGQPIVIQGNDPDNPPLFEGGGQALHLANCSYVTLKNIKVRGFPANGINIDDGGSYETPANNVILEDITILETGPTGNHDALKMSGVDNFVVRRCRFEGWGGSGIDMVGCHHGTVEDCTFMGRPGFSQSNGIQLKGGTEDVLVQCCFFKNAGQRSVNLGGSTGFQFFRPKVKSYEAKKITVAGNRFVGSMAPVAWVTADGGYVHHNTIVLPGKWVLRILQESRDARLDPCHDGVFEDNLIIFDARVQTFVNIGPRTSAGTFRFRHNAWHGLDRYREPSLPVPEIEGIYLRDLSFDRTLSADAQPQLDSDRVKGVGAHAYKRTR